MRLEHVAIYVKELESVRDFLSAIWADTPMTGIIIRTRAFVPISSLLTMERGSNV